MTAFVRVDETFLTGAQSMSDDAWVVLRCRFDRTGPSLIGLYRLEKAICGAKPLRALRARQSFTEL
jgi:hypothetical protein